MMTATGSQRDVIANVDAINTIIDSFTNVEMSGSGSMLELANSVIDEAPRRLAEARETSAEGEIDLFEARNECARLQTERDEAVEEARDALEALEHAQHKAAADIAKATQEARRLRTELDAARQEAVDKDIAFVDAERAAFRAAEEARMALTSANARATKAEQDVADTIDAVAVAQRAAAQATSQLQVTQASLARAQQSAKKRKADMSILRERANAADARAAEYKQAVLNLEAKLAAVQSDAEKQVEGRVAAERRASLAETECSRLQSESIADGIHMKEAAQALADVESDAKRALAMVVSSPHSSMLGAGRSYLRKVDAEAMRLRDDLAAIAVAAATDSQLPAAQGCASSGGRKGFEDKENALSPALLPNKRTPRTGLRRTPLGGINGNVVLSGVGLADPATPESIALQKAGAAGTTPSRLARAAARLGDARLALTPCPNTSPSLSVADSTSDLGSSPVPSCLTLPPSPPIAELSQDAPTPLGKPEAEVDAQNEGDGGRKDPLLGAALPFAALYAMWRVKGGVAPIAALAATALWAL